MGKSVRVCAAVALGNASRDREALELLEPVRPEGLSDHERELYWLQKLDGLIVTGRLPAARKVLAAVPHLAEGGQHARVLRFLEARLLLWEGKPREALELVAGPEERRGDKRSQQAIRAHAYAALGDDERCLEALAWLDREFGERGLRRLLDPVGPATPHVEAWLRGKRGPYR
jgi:predicted Zn-dependent protease